METTELLFKVFFVVVGVFTLLAAGYAGYQYLALLRSGNSWFFQDRPSKNKKELRRRPGQSCSWSYGMDPNMLRAGEERDIASFVDSDTLPTEIRAGERATLEGLGVIFQEVLPEDPIFRFVTLPTGWCRRKEGYWSVALLDQEGRRRARISYKPSPYDRAAYLFIE